MSHAFGTVGLLLMGALGSAGAAPFLVLVDADCKAATDYPYLFGHMLLSAGTDDAVGAAAATALQDPYQRRLRRLLRAPLRAVPLADEALTLLLLPWLAVGGFWRGAWGLVDFYHWGFSADPADLGPTGWLSFGVGAGWFLLARVRHALGRARGWAAPAPGAGSRLQTYVTAVMTVNLWRGVWYLIDHYAGVSVASAWLSHVLGWGVLALLGATKAAFAPPAVTLLDEPTAADGWLPVLTPSLWEARAVPQRGTREEEAGGGQVVGGGSGGGGGGELELAHTGHSDSH